MLEKKILDLLNQELDGVNSDKDRAAIQKVLRKKPEARKYLEDLQEMSLMFRRTNDIPAPAHLKSRILDALPFPKPTAPVRPSSARSFLQELRSGLNYRYVYSFAGGALAGILLFVLFTYPPADSTNMAGTIASGQPTAFTEAKADVNLNEITGTVIARRFPTRIVADLDLKAPQEVDVVLNFDQQQIQFDSFRPVADAHGTLVVLEGQLRLTVSGERKYEITFAGNTESRSPIAVRLFARGILLSEYELSFEQKENH
jgi:hypothetical protein